MSASTSTLARHPIGVVARRTGLKRELIRAWERRYGAVEPERTESNRRLYSDLDVERLALLREVTGLGHNIGQIADLPNGELEELLAQEHRSLPAGGSAGPIEALGVGEAAGRGMADGAPEAAAEDLVEAALEAVRRLDGRQLEATFERGALALSGLGVVAQVISPLMQRIGKLWAEGVLRPVHEHLATSVSRAFISALLGAHQPAESAPRLVATTPSGQHHELGSLIAALVAAAQGWQVTYLGPDLPAEEIAAAAHARNARVVALSLIYPGDDPNLPAELRRLVRLLPDGTETVVGGAGSASYAEVLDALSVRRADDLPQLHELFATLRSGSAARA